MSNMSSVNLDICGEVWGIQEIHDRCECTRPKGHEGDHKCWCGRERDK